MIRTAGEQPEQAERDLAHASQTVEDLETKLDEGKAAAEVMERKWPAGYRPTAKRSPSSSLR